MVESYQTSPMPSAHPPSPALPPGARCATHPEREASASCARCGTFVCPSCLVGEDLCAECKRRLLREGIPWTGQEKARASARRLRVRSALGLRIEMGVAVAGLLMSLGASNGFLPGFLARAGLGIWAVACLLGVAVAAGAARGYAKSEAGRPGPAVRGVFPRGEAGLIGGLGILPVLLSVGSLLGR